MLCCRFRLDRARGKSIKVNNLMAVPLDGYKMSDMQTFVDKIKYCLTTIEPGDIRDPDLLYEWLYEKVREWNPIADEVRKIRKSSSESNRRTWDYLVGALCRVLDYSHED